ncbi:MAG: MerR family transcriptional regulator [Betaproteobacteria bacterium]|nr:MerR family transcriptional regulator [Betaproteobacteria bacterium]
MNDAARDAAISLSIAAVERDTGLSKDTLRVWERRYGFPTPDRDSFGERAYSLVQVEKLRIVKRLLDAGHRPGRVVPLPLDALQRLANETVDQPQRSAEALLGASDLREHLALIRSHDVTGLRSALTHLLARVGVARFVLEGVAPLSAAVGDAWVRGQMEVFEEHAHTEVVQTVLRQAIAGIPAAEEGARPRVLLTTFPGEPHGLGLLMAQAMFALEGCHCISLGLQTPVWDTVLAARAYRTDIVGLSFTGCMGPNQIVDGLAELAAKLPATVQVWAGGSAPVLHRRTVPRVRALAGFDALAGELRRWRQDAAGSVSP